jgi:hypothetical protein
MDLETRLLIILFHEVLEIVSNCLNKILSDVILVSFSYQVLICL